MSGDPVREQRARWERKRGRAARELLETEMRYLQQLHGVDTFFVAILRAKGTLKPAQLQAVFGPWGAICSASQALLPHLERGHWGAGLQGFCPHLPLYISYAANGEQARTTLQERLQKSKQFRRFVKLQEGRPEFGGLRLEELLLLPLQRLQRYETLTEALAENTSPSSPDYQQLLRAARSVGEATQRVRAITGEQENNQELRRIRGLLSGRRAKGLTAGLAPGGPSPGGAATPAVPPVLRRPADGQAPLPAAPAARGHLLVPSPLPAGPVPPRQGLWPRGGLRGAAQPLLPPRETAAHVHRSQGAGPVVPEPGGSHQPQLTGAPQTPQGVREQRVPGRNSLRWHRSGPPPSTHNQQPSSRGPPRDSERLPGPSCCLALSLSPFPFPRSHLI
ncbi:rho guanine nucleotide exchange factor 39 isoform X1 [Tachyglossus aculeatus]|uniref:rho guanine nucleotide exchange factor 39 isoform X1 n=1 Tax=Tachyglossus aculeatus TaxID=9261 RepID=UPI0018F756BC|nr:rho guanine nucleotide exchange factor 39 isoform X1 [Tachyglossus aculeatus]